MDNTDSPASAARRQGPSSEEIEKERDASRARSYRLVVILVSVLAGLCVLIVLLPVMASFLKAADPTKPCEAFDKLIEFSKWALAVLLGAFGAWIGAGAAYFFGKENLAESSRSTETALRIQQEAFRPRVPEKIRDMALTAMNSAFLFELSVPKADVLKKLETLRGYWFVPVTDSAGVLKDIIHARVFWKAEPPAEKTLCQIIEELNADPAQSGMHGEALYLTVAPDHKVMDVYELVRRKNVEIVIVVDEKGKPTHCISKTDLTAFLRCANRI